MNGDEALESALNRPAANLQEDSAENLETENLETGDWETVPLPASLDVDALPMGESIDLMASLEQQNQTLRDRVVYLESALENSQTSLRQELERWESLALSGDERIQEKDAAIAKHIADITTSQEKITQLFQELEQAYQTSQRQQILTETLNGQLQNSQERVAQLERECSGIQQRYVEQTQISMQHEHQSRDLQARLYRQQRYTLQYKAALEKCLEVPQPIANAPALISETIHTNSNLLGKQVNIPKPTPVQPWSAPSTEETEDLSQGAWLNSFLSESEQFPTDEVVTNFAWQSEYPDDLPQNVSFDLAEEVGLQTDSRLVAWESEDPTSKMTLEENQISHQSSVESAAPSPFITLQPMSELDLENAGELPIRKRESLAAVDLPNFPKVSEATLPIASTSVIVKE